MQKSLAGGRFTVEKKLGQGAQGLVYLATDEQLRRRVAIKVLHSQGESALAEARVVSKLQHPNIVTLHDVFAETGHPCLVFEYVEGQTLADVLRASGHLPAIEAVRLLLPILDGLALAHAQGMVHRDIKPQNIILDQRKSPRLMDFGVATPRKTGSAGISGTVGYIAPEILQNLPVDAQADVFAAGMTLYQLLTGRLAAEGDSPFVILQRTLSSPFVPPSTLQAGIDERLDQIVMTALCKSADERYVDAAAFRDALAAWLERPEAAAGAAAEDAAARHSTLEFLLRRMRHTADFPALSQTISAINKIDEADTERLQSLSEVILKDFSLTNKLLRIVNSATYGQFGGTISTVSRAIVILGFDNIRNLAVTLLLFEHMHNRNQAVKLREAVLHAFFGGLLARMLGQKAGWREAEGVMICGMFQHLGRLLTLYYFPEESNEIERCSQQQGISDILAAERVLGISYRELALGVVQSWNFPERMVHSMRPLPDNTIREPQNTGERLRVFANLAYELLPCLDLTDKDLPVFMARLVQRFAPAVSLHANDYEKVMQETAKQYLDYMSLLGVDTTGSAYAKRLAKLAGVPLAQLLATRDAEGDTLTSIRLETPPVEEVVSPQQITSLLAAGVQDITNTLVGEFKLNDLLRMILETMFRSVGFERVLFCTRDAKTNRMLARFGFGPDIQRIVPVFGFDLGGVNDVFQLVVARNADVLIEDIDAESIRNRIPQWYRSSIHARTFIVLPLVIDKKPVGLFYGDRSDAHALQIPHDQLNLLKTMRNQAILAVRQKQTGG
ncbi:serine/threonine protein kinase [Chitinilyticum piscinae]|uniref:HDOD domain-containing protein n=1 Tax=Chitinilyticum piscinae TaxID=2866724 RepID=A0A8J7FMN9_9NEIS|nr:serine/threonine protein kinase [Chitinilyticum piscinae]MBE9609346.1 HDOD domain-containing protein [Chitinilyticum piscinae]